MARQKLYETPAQRQQAYRRRIQDKLAGLIPLSKPSRKKTRPQRVKSFLAELELLADEYQHWLDSLPENLTQSQLACQLEETIESLQELATQLEQIDLPRGFGR